jgi:hypothetical protein
VWAWIVAGVLIVHGLLHALGIATTFGGAQVDGMSGAPTLSVGAAERGFASLWAVALIGLVAAGLAVRFHQDWWRPMAAAAALVSMIPIAVWWADARFGALVNIVVIALVLAAPPIPGCRADPNEGAQSCASVYGWVAP